MNLYKMQVLSLLVTAKGGVILVYLNSILIVSMRKCIHYDIRFSAIMSTMQ